MKEKQLKQRNINFDILRALAAFGVVCIHSTIYEWKNHSPSETEFLVFNIINCLGRCAVPLFFMLSGAFMLQAKKCEKDILKKAGKLLFIYVVWSALYACAEMGSGFLHFRCSQWLEYFINAKFHLWFLPIIICIYMIFPILYAFVQYEDGRYVRYAVWIFFIFGICKNTLIVLFPENTYLNAVLGKCSVELCEYTGYFILGYYLMYLGKKEKKIYRAFMTYLIAVVFCIVATQLVSVRRNELVNVFSSYFSLPVYIEAVSIFTIFCRWKIDWQKCKRLGYVGSYIAGTSLGVYLLHPFVMEHLDSVFGINAKMCHAIISLPMVAVLSYSISVVVVGAMKKIPLLRGIC